MRSAQGTWSSSLCLFHSSLHVMVYWLLSRNSEQGIVRYAWSLKTGKTCSMFNTLYFLSIFKQHLRCAQKKQYFAENYSGRCSPEGGCCCRVKILSRWLKAASCGLDKVSREYALAVPEWQMTFGCPYDPKAAVQFSISALPSEQGQPIVPVTDWYLRCTDISGGAQGSFI